MKRRQVQKGRLNDGVNGCGRRLLEAESERRRVLFDGPDFG